MFNEGKLSEFTSIPLSYVYPKFSILSSITETKVRVVSVVLFVEDVLNCGGCVAGL